MSRVRFIRTMIVEVELNKEHYPEGFTLEQMAQYDINAMKETGEYEYLFSENLMSDKVTFQIIK